MAGVENSFNKKEIKDNLNSLPNGAITAPFVNGNAEILRANTTILTTYTLQALDLSRIIRIPSSVVSNFDITIPQSFTGPSARRFVVINESDAVVRLVIDGTLTLNYATDPFVLTKNTLFDIYRVSSLNYVVVNSGGSSSLPTDVEDALLDANTPSASNVFATMDDITNASSTIKMLPADVTTTLATAQTITELTQALEINSTYIIRGNLRNGCSGTGGVKFAISYPTSTIAVVQAVGQLASINTASWNIHGNAISGVLQNAVSTFAGNSGTYNLQGTIKTGGTAGNLVFSFASTTAGQTSTIFTDSSYIEIIKVV